MLHNTKEEILLREEDQLPKLVAPQASLHWRKEPYYGYIFAAIYLHIASIYGVYLGLTAAKWSTLVFAFIYYIAGFLGITAGAHRLWAHRTYKAKFPLRVFLMLCNSAILQINVIWWATMHRLHHKYSDTDGDPHNATRGFFFSHIGWFLVKRHPEVANRKKFIDMSDLKSDPVLQFQRKYTTSIGVIMSFIVPVLIPCLWGESFIISWHMNIIRLMITYNFLSIVNSFAHKWGPKPYDKKLPGVQNMAVAFLSLGEGYHNYHHTFPWDYRVAELGNYTLNLTTFVIDVFEYFGLAYDLQMVKHDIIEARAQRTGDGSRNG